MTEKFDYHIQETNRRLNSIEDKLDTLIETKIQVQELARRVSVFYAAVVSVITAVVTSAAVTWFRHH